MKLLIGIKKHIPEYCRVIRVIRDIPKESILAGNTKTNLRQLMQNEGIECRCVRCREIGDSKFEIGNLKLETIKYKANDGLEFFIAMEEPTLDKIVGLCRLRLPSKKAEMAFKSIEGSALVRELHVYGRQKSLEVKKGLESKTQHLGLGKRLMAEAERIAKKAGYDKIAVIAAIGTREYYRKLGYGLEETYMTKKL
jgi:elongator complex protein 3